MIKGSTYHQVITIINLYAPNNRTPKIHKVQADKLKRELENTAIIVGDFPIFNEV